MNYIEEYSTAQNVLYLAKCAINKVVPDVDRVQSMNVHDVYAFAKKHSLSAIVAMALESAGFSDEISRSIRGTAIRRTIVFESEKNAISKELEAAGIWHVLLKGAVIKDIYPEFGIREMADYDILIDADRAHDVKSIMNRLGYSTESYGNSNHDAYHKPPVLNFEMHRSLFHQMAIPAIYNYYTGIKSKLIKDDGKQFSYHFSPEDFYIYLIAHEYKHYSNCGTGLRSLLDVYVYEQKYDLNREYIESELKQLGIADFEEISRKLALGIFGDAALEDDLLNVLDSFINSGTYGSWEQFIDNGISKHGRGRGAKLKYILRRLIPEYSNFEINCPSLSKFKILFPFYIVYRFIKTLLLKGKSMLHELKLVKAHSNRNNT